MEAAKRQQEEMIRLLLAEGADPDTIDNVRGGGFVCDYHKFLEMDFVVCVPHREGGSNET